MQQIAEPCLSAPKNDENNGHRRLKASITTPPRKNRHFSTQSDREPFSKNI
jgi:hypothetical protein